MRGTSATPSTPMNRAAALTPEEPARVIHSGTSRSGVFIAYSHRDRDLLGELQVHLKPLQKAWMVDLWDDFRVDAGPRGEEELRRAVAATRVAVLLVSPGLLSSPFVTEHHLPEMLAAQEHPRAAVMCLYLRPAMDVFADRKFADPQDGSPRAIRITNFKGLNDPLYPLAALEKPARHRILQAAAEEIIQAAHRNTSVAATQ